MVAILASINPIVLAKYILAFINPTGLGKKIFGFY